MESQVAVSQSTNVSSVGCGTGEDITNQQGNVASTYQLVESVPSVGIQNREPGVNQVTLQSQGGNIIHVMEEAEPNVVLELQSSEDNSLSVPLTKETFVELGHSDTEAESISQIFIEVCSAESMGLLKDTGAIQETEENNPYKLLKDQCVQANDYEIERSGKLPARRRVIPRKFRDYKNPDSEDEKEDSDWDPENDFMTSKQKRERRGQKKTGQETEIEPRQRGRPKGRRGRPVKRSGGIQCPECKKMFTQRGNLTAHMRIHKDEKPFLCDVEGCDKKFRTNEVLRRHKLSHLGIKPFECEICQKKLSCNVSLQEHMSIHTDTRPYQCDKCAKSFRHISTLSRHMLIHSGATPFKCEECGKEFAQMAYLRSHQRTHTGVKPYVCDQCGKKFGHQSDLMRHKIIHTGLKPYACDICNAKFSDPSSCRRHVKEHASSKPYPCEFCGEEFKRPAQLKTHTNKIHNSFSRARKGKGEGSTIETLYQDLTTRSGQQRLVQQGKIVQLLNNLNNSQPMTFITEAAISDISMETPEGECEQILIEAAQAGEVTVQTIGEQFIVTSLPDNSEQMESSENCDLTLEPQVVETEQTNDVNFVKVTEENVNPENEVIATECQSANVETNLQVVEDSVEYMYEIMDSENQGDVKIQEVAKDPSGNSHVENTNNENMNVDSPESTAIDYVSNPDFASQDYYNWLSNFTELCKLVPMPLDVDLFQKISQVHKTLSDVMATPSGILSMKENYKILMSIGKDLNIIINEHLAFVLKNLDNDKDNS